MPVVEWKKEGSIAIVYMNNGENRHNPDFAKGTLFCAEALAHGAYLHPRHNMFLSLAHTEEDIDRALVATDRAFAAVAARFGRAVARQEA